MSVSKLIPNMMFLEDRRATPLLLLCVFAVQIANSAFHTMEDYDDGMSLNVTYTWVYQNPRFKPKLPQLLERDSLDYVHMGMLAVLPEGSLLAAWQGATAFWEGSQKQGIYFSRSVDGRSWSRPELAFPIHPQNPVWAPVLHCQGNLVWLFYSQSRPQCWWWGEGGLHWACGGDLRYVVSSDGAKSWSTSKVLLSFDMEGGIAKMIANRLICGLKGQWLLPFWREMGGHNCTSSPTMHGKGGVLISADQGMSWTETNIQLGTSSRPTWLIEGTISGIPHGENPTLKSSAKYEYLQLFRTQVGKLYCSYSTDGMQWTDALPMDLPNPNSKVDMLSLPEGPLVLAFNDDAQKRTPLSLATSHNGGITWHRRLKLEDEMSGSFSYPTLQYLEKTDEVIVIYTVCFPHQPRFESLLVNVWQRFKPSLLKLCNLIGFGLLPTSLHFGHSTKKIQNGRWYDKDAWGYDVYGLRLARLDAHWLRI